MQEEDVSLVNLSTNPRTHSMKTGRKLRPGKGGGGSGLMGRIRALKAEAERRIVFITTHRKAQLLLQVCPRFAKLSTNANVLLCSTSVLNYFRFPRAGTEPFWASHFRPLSSEHSGMFNFLSLGLTSVTMISSDER